MGTSLRSNIIKCVQTVGTSLRSNKEWSILKDSKYGPEKPIWIVPRKKGRMYFFLSRNRALAMSICKMRWSVLRKKIGSRRFFEKYKIILGLTSYISPTLWALIPRDCSFGVLFGLKVNSQVGRSTTATGLNEAL